MISELKPYAYAYIGKDGQPDGVSFGAHPLTEGDLKAGYSQMPLYTRATPNVPELVDTANAKLKEQSYGIQSGQTNFGGPRGIWLECKSCYRSEVIVGSNSDEWMKVPDKTIAEIFRRYGWTGRGDKMMDQRCPECSNKNTAPDVSELVRYDLACDFDGKYHPDIIEVELGDYVRYDQAAAMMAAKDAEIERLREALNYYANVSPISYDMGRTARAALSGKETK